MKTDTRAGNRLAVGGRINREIPLDFHYNERPMRGFAGDTLASALLANGVRVIGRSFKYHRPRGIFGAGFEDPNAMLAVRDGYGYDPAIRAGQIRLSAGMRAWNLTGWPSADFDLGAVAGLAAPFLKAGFYYKTFMAPNWKWYEPLIRRATGYGRPSPIPQPRAREHRFDSCDVLVIGGGAAGMAAARGLVGAGLRIVIADDGPALGGALRWCGDEVEGQAGETWASETAAALGRDDHVRVLTDTVVTGAYDDNVFTLVETLWRGGGGARERLWQLRASHVILAAGAVDRPLVFAGNDRPGIMLAGAVERYLGEFAVAPGADLAVFTNNDFGYRAARAALRANIPLAAVIDTRTDPAAALLEEFSAAGVQVFTGSEVVATRGRSGLRAVSVMGRGGGRPETLAAAALAVSGGTTPLIHLAAHRGIKPVYDPIAATFLCPDLPPGWIGAGAVMGPSSMAQCLHDGMAAADAIRGRAGKPAPRVHDAGGIDAYWRAGRGKAAEMFIDLQNDVTVADIDIAAREGYVSVEHLKRYTTLGMGTDQGRTSNINGLANMAALTGRDIGAVGTTTFRPPFTGVRMGTIAGVHLGRLYRPKRLMPAHERHAEAGAAFVDFGWQRPDWYTENGSTREDAVAAELAAVRKDVGIFDASPLGKIEIAGPDAAAFLDRFYVTNVTTLKPGRIRYSVMLHEDGVIFDDGVIARTGENRFIAGPSSGNADGVAAWFERWRQTEWPWMRVAVAPVTSNWACMAIAGPKARALLAALAPECDVSAAAFPHMSFRETRLSGVPTRISRVSFTGELQYEIAVPARFGDALMQRLRDVGGAFDARLVGMEAWLRLRLEKGYIHVGADTNGRTTPGDIGMAGVVAGKKADFIGKRSLSLAFGASATREELVGLRAGKSVLRVGGRILTAGTSTPPCDTDGYVTSACFSPAAGEYIGLALVERGRARMGERVRVFDDGALIAAEICAPCFYDPANERLQA